MKNPSRKRIPIRCAACGEKVGWWLGARSPYIKEGTWQSGSDYFCSDECVKKRIL